MRGGDRAKGSALRRYGKVEGIGEDREQSGGKSVRGRG